ncbi:MAG: DUF3160 domain-containing protein [Myxococcales bacterium]|nr:DUF3160 domain-containing protein [Myxococcales bacterium]
MTPAMAGPFAPKAADAGPWSAALVRAPSLDARWLALPASAREAVLERGFAVVPEAHPTSRLGDYHASLRDDRAPSMVTMDALFFLVHVAFDRALADVDAAVIVPSAATLLRRLEARLSAETRLARPDVAPSYVIARGLVALALALAPLPPTGVDESGIAPLLVGEKERILAHAGVAPSPWLGAPVDYGAMAPRGQADREEPELRWFLALSWLQNAALWLEGTGERSARRSRVDVATARAHARAALLLSRLLDPDVDPEASAAWERIERAAEVLIGDADDVTPRDLAGAARRAELDPASRDWFADVARVDRVRHGASWGRPAPIFRVLGPRITPDAEVLQALTFPVVGARARSTADPPGDDREGVRALPTGLDVAAWLGSTEARAALAATGQSGYERYEETLGRLIEARPAEGPLTVSGRHRTPYLSMLEAIETWLAPSAGDVAIPAANSPEWRSRKAEVALAAWTALRHDAASGTRLPTAAFRMPAREPALPEAAPVFVEPHPEAIARLLSVVRQIRRALVSENLLRADAMAFPVLDEVDDLLWTALGAALHEAVDEPIPIEIAAPLAALPARLRALEAVLAETGSADVPIVADVHLDQRSARVLEQATGRLQEAWVAVREPGTHRLWLALGASVPHHEIVQPAADRLSDGAWRARIRDEGEPAPSVLARTYVVTPAVSSGTADAPRDAAAARGAP